MILLKIYITLLVSTISFVFFYSNSITLTLIHQPHRIILHRHRTNIISSLWFRQTAIKRTRPLHQIFNAIHASTIFRFFLLRIAVMGKSTL